MEQLSASRLFRVNSTLDARNATGALLFQGRSVQRLFTLANRPVPGIFPLPSTQGVNPLIKPMRVVFVLFVLLGNAFADTQVLFSPHGGCTHAVVQNLDNAHSTVYVQAYSFTSKEISQALVNAARRGVKISVVLDSSNETGKYSAATFLRDMGILPLIDAEHTIAHNKVIIIDGAIVITGSFNFTRAAEENNAENLLIIRDPAIAQKYLANWVFHSKHSHPYRQIAKS
jgi:phosphatidylserine/phosphatidylglycerophosphate/cardiolipin synthase-like enzyme